MSRPVTTARAKAIANDFAASGDWSRFLWAVSDAAAEYGKISRATRFAFTEELVKAMEQHRLAVKALDDEHDPIRVSL